MIKIAVTVAAICLLVGACGPATGPNSAACRRAQDEIRIAAAQLEHAIDASGGRSGGVSGEMLRIATEMAEEATEDHRRACATDRASARDDSAPTAAPEAPEARSSELPAPPTDTPNTRYVSVAMTEERSSPGGAVVNRIYRGQRLEVTDRQGGWVRVTGLQYDPRWVRASDLSRERPEPLDQPTLASELMDERIQGIPGVGEEGHDEADVRALRIAAARLLASGQCETIEMGNKSVNRAGFYWLNCGEDTNRFFTMRNGEPRFCGRNGDSC